ncbi:class I SAM-dependent methyltransferase [Brasilonema octagenarum]|nr:class I SAM-dependent methyltransferase [Brasilonema octagenarum]
MNDSCNQTLQNHVSAQPRYGIDAPGFIQGFFLVGISAFLAGFFIPSFNLFGIHVAFLGSLLCFTALIPLALGTSMAIYGLRGKFNIRDLMLNMIAWRGDEQVLDVGTGRGLLAIGAAKCLSSGKAIGIDIWRAQDLSGNTMENTLRNVALEGMQGKVELKKEDIRSTSFADQSFDVILSLLCLHNIEDEKERDVACHEIARILKPGGTVLIADYIPTGGYAKALAAAGLAVKSSKSHLRAAYALMWIVTATKEGNL